MVQCATNAFVVEGLNRDRGQRSFEVNLLALRHNYRIAVRESHPALCYPVVKLDAYGLGIGPVVSALLYEGVSGFFVASVEEALDVRQRTSYGDVFVLDGPQRNDVSVFLEHNLIPVLNDLEQVAVWQEKACALQKRLPAFLQVETGLQRRGLTETEMAYLAHSPDYHSGIHIQCILSQLACSYKPQMPANLLQRDTFERICKLWPCVPKSLSATGGIYMGDPFRYEITRPGRLLYGDPLGAPERLRGEISPVAALTANVLHIREVPEGTPVGYEGIFVTQRPTRLAIVGLGYAHGFPRCLSQGGVGVWKERRFPIVGNLSMDMLTLDITESYEGEISVGSPIEFLGPTLTLGELARMAHTNVWEILCRLGSTLSRCYRNNFSLYTALAC